METNSNQVNSILVRTSDISTNRGLNLKSIDVVDLAEHVDHFLTQMQQIFQNAPSSIGHFEFTEFTVSAEISGSGKLNIIGSGVEAGVKGGLTFKFERK